ncbi:MAG: hypothetical protein J3K34DRAFT_435354 [Monoraphidium minutum]|nr:MAG: hypothetical protein J3K34DRAFT_435354 [Monoraphidium minutum]
MLLLGAWLCSACTRPTNTWPGLGPMLSSCTVQRWRPPVKVVDPWNSPTPAALVAAVVLYLTHVSRSAIWMSAVALVGEYHVNSGLGVSASCRLTTMPGCAVMKGYICSAAMLAQGSAARMSSVSLCASVTMMTGWPSSLGERSIDRMSPRAGRLTQAVAQIA